MTANTELKLNDLFPMPGSHYRSKRVGRGIGSGKGKTSGSGTKGQRSRTGVAMKGFEGGQMPIHRRLPKRGFKNCNKVHYQIININVVEYYIQSGVLSKDNVSRETLYEAGIISKKNVLIKLLAKDKINVAVNFTVDAASNQAIKYVEEVGGTVITTKASA